MVAKLGNAWQRWAKMGKAGQSWAKKFAKRHDLKMTGARVKELGDEDVRTYSVQLRQMASRVKQAGPAYEEVSTMLRQAAEKLVAARIVVSRRSG